MKQTKSKFRRIGCYHPSNIQHIELAAEKIIYWYTGLNEVAIPYGIIRDNRLTALFLMCLTQDHFRIRIFDAYIERIR